MKLFKSFILFAIVLASTSASFAKSGDTMNLHFSPLSLLDKSLQFGFERTISTDFTLGGEFGYRRESIDSGGYFYDYTGEAFAVGIVGTWYSNSTFTDGLYLSPGVHYAQAIIESTGGGIRAEGNYTVLSFFGGYGWFWDSFNMKLGLGVLATAGGDVKVRDSSGKQVTFNSSASAVGLEYNLGWTF